MFLSYCTNFKHPFCSKIAMAWDWFNIVFAQQGGKHKAEVRWPVRLNILKGVARGLHYLHALAQPRIIHRDIKASNILLDKSFEPKIADFGLALLFPDEQSHIMTMNIAGTKWVQSLRAHIFELNIHLQGKFAPSHMVAEFCVYSMS